MQSAGRRPEKAGLPDPSKIFSGPPGAFARRAVDSGSARRSLRPKEKMTTEIAENVKKILRENISDNDVSIIFKIIINLRNADPFQKRIRFSEIVI